MLKYPIVISDNIIPLIYDRAFKSFANLYSKELVDFIINLCKLNMKCNNYNLINNEITTFYKDDKLMTLFLESYVPIKVASSSRVNILFK